MGGYAQLTQEEQYQIYILRKAGDNQTEIADLLERDKSTISSLRYERCCNLPWILPRTIRLARYTATFSNSEPLVSSARIDSLEIIQITVFLESGFSVDFPIDPSTNLILSLSM